MSTQHHSELERIVERWEQRHEWRLLSRTAPRSLIIALVASLIVGALGYFRFRLGAEQLALIAAGFCGLGVMINLLRTLLFPRDLPVRARYFDIEFGLQERVSTALELLSGRIKTHPEIAARQLDQALAAARAVDPRERIALDFRRGELAALLALFIALLGMIALPAIVGADFLADATSPAAEEAAEDVREMIELAAKDPDLDDIQRQELLDALEVALDRLQEEDISQEEAFAAMSQLEARLDELADELGETMELDQSALAAGLEALDEYLPQDMDSGVEEPGDNLEALSQALEQLSQDAREMSAQELQDAAQAMQAAADELAQLDAEMQQRMQDMAQAMQEGESALSEQNQAMQEAIEQQQQEAQRQANAQMSLQEQSDRAQDSSEAIARQQAQQGEQQQQAAQMGDSSEQSESGEPRSGQQSDQQSDQARPGENQGNQQAQRNASRSGQASQRNQDSRASGGGAGQGSPSNVSMAGSGGEDQGAETGNQPGGRSIIEYEALYSPSGIQGGGSQEIRLETDPGDMTSAEGEFDDNPLGESRVSYDTVFSDYQQAANRALESDYVPLGLRDVVREYFTSLQPDR